MTKAKKPTANKATKKTPAKKAVPKAKTPGVIATIVATIGRERGASTDELVEVLKAKFPDREEAGRRRTVLIQANKNAKKKLRDEKRGLVYHG